MFSIRSARITMVVLCAASVVPAGLAEAGLLDGVPGFTVPCERALGCVPQATPGAPDRDVRPFEGSLGRPCGWRYRPTPSGTRKVRVCY